MEYPVLIISIVLLVTSVLLTFKWRLGYWERKCVYTPPPAIPFGNVKDLFMRKIIFGEDLVNLYFQLKSMNTRYCGYYLLWRPILFVSDLNLVRNILTRDFQYFTDHLNFLNEDTDPLTGHLFTMKGPKWKALRIKLTPTFTSGKIKAMFQTLVDCTKELSTILGEAEERSQPIDVKDVFARYTTDVIGSCAFGIECNCLKNPDAEFRKFGRRIFENDFWQATKNMLSVLIPEHILKALRFSLTRKDVENFFMHLVEETVEYRQKNNVVRKDFMQLLLDLKNQKLVIEEKDDQNDKRVDYYKDGLTMNEITAQAFVFFLGGFETSSTTLNFLVYELANNLDIQDRLRKETADILTKHNGKITYDAVMEMTYLEKCIQETLRKYPPLNVITRECTKDYKIPDSDLVVEKGTGVFISAYAIQHDPEYYPDPEKFDPERFSEENKSKRPPFTYLPFGEGPRLCIGLRFGVLQVKVGLVAAIRNYRFKLNPKTKTPIEYDPNTFVLNVKGGVWVDVERIN